MVVGRWQKLTFFAFRLKTKIFFASCESIKSACQQSRKATEGSSSNIESCFYYSSTVCDVKWIIVVTNLRLKQCCYVSDFLKMLTNIFLFKYWLGDTSKRRESFFAISSRQPMATNRSENSGGKLKIWHLFPYLRWIYHRRTSMQPQWQSSPWKKKTNFINF